MSGDLTSTIRDTIVRNPHTVHSADCWKRVGHWECAALAAADEIDRLTRELGQEQRLSPGMARWGCPSCASPGDDDDPTLELHCWRCGVVYCDLEMLP